MKRLLFLCCLLPLFSFAQSYAKEEPGANATLSYDITSSYGTNWQTLLRPTLQNPVNAFYRFSYKDGEYRLELKLSAGGAPFVVAKNATLDLGPEECTTITLYNEHYESSCKGCGSRSANGNILGVTLTFVMDKSTVNTLSNNYLYHIRLHLADNDLGGTVYLKRSETFLDELVAFRHRIEHHN